MLGKAYPAEIRTRLAQLWPTMSAAEIARELGMTSRNSVVSLARTMGLTKPPGARGVPAKQGLAEGRNPSPNSVRTLRALDPAPEKQPTAHRDTVPMGARRLRVARVRFFQGTPLCLA